MPSNYLVPSLPLPNAELQATSVYIRRLHVLASFGSLLPVEGSPLLLGNISVSFGAFFYATRYVPATGWRMRVFVLARFAGPEADGLW